MEFRHYSVMASQCIEMLDIKPDGIYVDCTLGGAGHTKLILERLSRGGRVIGIDRDSDAIQNAKNTVNDSRLITVKENFENIASVLTELGISEVDGILMDLGVSSYQLDEAERGFSYMQDAALDMRMDRQSPLTAREVINTYSHGDLTRILRDFGEEKFASKIASAICNARQKKEIETTLELAELISASVPPKYRHEGGHPAKRSFQAIRIEVNSELSAIPKAINDGARYLKKGGRMAIISFHSLEDRIVKNSFVKLERPCTCPPDFPQCVCGARQVAKIITKKPLLPDESELLENSRSHSAKLRVCEKV